MKHQSKNEKKNEALDTLLWWKPGITEIQKQLPQQDSMYISDKFSHLETRMYVYNVYIDTLSFTETNIYMDFSQKLIPEHFFPSVVFGIVSHP